MQETLEHGVGTRVASADGMPRSYLTLELAGQVFGIEVARVLRIHDALPVARLPQAPHGVEGIVDIDGESLAIADLCGSLGLHGVDASSSGRLVVLQLGNPPRAIGVMADRVLDVIAIRPEETESLPAGSAEGGPVTGIARVAGRLVMLLAIDQVVGNLTVGPFDFD
ncbi:MAG: chemotaxis protein CheW [Pseudomonadota bacterium]